jgi:hypothetical protein
VKRQDAALRQRRAPPAGGFVNGYAVVGEISAKGQAANQEWSLHKDVLELSSDFRFEELPGGWKFAASDVIANSVLIREEIVL